MARRAASRRRTCRASSRASWPAACRPRRRRRRRPPPRPRPPGRWHFPGPAGLAAGRLRQVRPHRAQGPQPHPEDQRRQPASQLGDHPARHQPRRRRHHRAGSLSRAAQQGKREERRQGHDAGVHDQGGGGGAEEVPAVQCQPGRRAAGAEELFPHRLCRRYAQRPGGAGDQGRRQEGHFPDQHRDGRTGEEGPRRQARARPT